MILKHSLTILSARRNDKGKHSGLTDLGALGLCLLQSNTAELTGTGIKGTHLRWEVSYCLRGSAQKCHSGFSFSPKTTSTSHDQCPESLGIKRSSHVTSRKVPIHPVLTSQAWLGCSDLVSSSQSRRWKGTNHPPVSAVNTAPGLSAHFPRCSVCDYSLHCLSVPVSWQPLATLQLNCTVSSAGWIQCFYLYLQISHEWTLIESTDLNPSAKNILHIVNMAIFNTVSILKYFHVHDHILLYLKLNLYTLKNY